MQTKVVDGINSLSAKISCCSLHESVFAEDHSTVHSFQRKTALCTSWGKPITIGYNADNTTKLHV